MKTKETLIENLKLENLVQELIKNRDVILNDWAKAYISETGVLPSEVELVEQRSDKIENGKIETIYFFRRKINGKNKGNDNE